MFLPLLSPDRLNRRVMFAVEFIDPFTGWAVGDGLKVVAEGLGKPLRPQSRRYVWLEFDPAAQRQIRVTAESIDKRFRKFDEVLTVPQHVQDIPPNNLLFRRALVPNAAHLPPPGLIAASGQVKRGNPPAPVAEVKVVIQLRHDSDDQGLGGTTFTARYEGLSDPSGGFVAAVTDLGDIKPDRKADGSLVAWLQLTDETNAVRFTSIQDFQAGRLTWLTPGLRWETLPTAAPFP